MTEKFQHGAAMVGVSALRHQLSAIRLASSTLTGQILGSRRPGGTSVKILLSDGGAAPGAAVLLGLCWDKLNDLSSITVNTTTRNVRKRIGTPEALHVVRGAVYRPAP